MNLFNQFYQFFVQFCTMEAQSLHDSEKEDKVSFCVIIITDVLR